MPLAHGNDGMGSLRLPAAACGLVTLKPGSGVVPADIGADSWSGMAVNGALATTVADLAVAHAVLAGEEPGPPPAPGRPLRIARLDPVAGARRAGRRRHPRGRRRRRRRCSTAAGHTVVRRDPPITPGAAAGALARWMVGAEDDAEHLGIDRARAAAAQPHARPDRPAGPAGRAGPAADGGAVPRAHGGASSSDVDVLLSPVTTGPPLRRPAVARALLPGQHHGQRPLGAVDGGLEPGRAPGGRRCPPAPARRGCPSRSSSSAPRAPKDDYSGWPESWSVGSRGAATHPSSTPPHPRRGSRLSTRPWRRRPLPTRDGGDSRGAPGDGNSSLSRGLGLDDASSHSD